GSATMADNRGLRKRLARYAIADRRKAVRQLLTTLVPLAASAAALLYGIDHGFWLAAFLALPAAAFFASRRANTALGLAVSFLTLIPYTFWRRDHALHHAGSGNLDRRGRGDLT